MVGRLPTPVDVIADSLGESFFHLTKARKEVFSQNKHHKSPAQSILVLFNECGSSQEYFALFRCTCCWMLLFMYIYNVVYCWFVLVCV